jgi:hypothetical protein
MWSDGAHQFTVLRRVIGPVAHHVVTPGWGTAGRGLDRIRQHLWPGVASIASANTCGRGCRAVVVLVEWAVLASRFPLIAMGSRAVINTLQSLHFIMWKFVFMSFPDTSFLKYDDTSLLQLDE